MEIGTGYSDLAKWLHAGSTASSFVILPPDVKPNSELLSSQEPGMIGVYSSGSTGRPKLLWWKVTDLLKDSNQSSHTSDWTWATCYQPWSFAGIHLACQAHRSSGQVLLLGRDWELNHSILTNKQPQALSATPTFIDLLLQSKHVAADNDWSPKQITIGGEILRPATGKRIKSAFPSSRFTLIYASAESGLIAKTHQIDGWFPLSSLQQQFKNFKLVDDELHLKVHDNWLHTRDLCEIKNDHFRILGRLDRVLNIGGDKICLDEIESVAESFPEVRKANAVAKPNAIVGQVVALNLEPATSEANDELLDTIMQKMRKQLPKPAWPRWCAWGNIQVMDNGKRSHDEL